MTSTPTLVDPRKFPCLMHHPLRGLVVLFQEERKGVVVHEGNTWYKIGDIVCDWIMKDFTLYEGDIILRN